MIVGGQDNEGFFLYEHYIDTERKKVKIPYKDPGYKTFYRKTGSFKRRTVRGTIITPEISTINLILYEKSTRYLKFEKKHINFVKFRSFDRLPVNYLQIFKFFQIKNIKELKLFCDILYNSNIKALDFSKYQGYKFFEIFISKKFLNNIIKQKFHPNKKRLIKKLKKNRKIKVM